ncbi:hypothetical protein CKA32_000754 [Geitlerinema sp. FC II]|nr:hypothetical protein CKA32_000754 [Geitlerinema sp. FC II]
MGMCLANRPPSSRYTFEPKVLNGSLQSSKNKYTNPLKR